MRVSVDCLVPLDVLVQNQASWMTYHDLLLGLGLLAILTSVMAFVIEAVTRWSDDWLYGVAVVLFVVGLGVSIGNGYWTTVARTNPIYYAVSTCPARYAAPSLSVVPLDGTELR